MKKFNSSNQLGNTNSLFSFTVKHNYKYLLLFTLLSAGILFSGYSFGQTPCCVINIDQDAAGASDTRDDAIRNSLITAIEADTTLSAVPVGHTTLIVIPKSGSTITNCTSVDLDSRSIINTNIYSENFVAIDFDAKGNTDTEPEDEEETTSSSTDDFIIEFGNSGEVKLDPPSNKTDAEVRDLFFNAIGANGKEKVGATAIVVKGESQVRSITAADPNIGMWASLSQWGIIILALLLLTIGSVYIVKQRKATLATTEGANLNLQTPLFNKTEFRKIAVKSIPFILGVIVLISVIEGGLYTRNIVGTIISGLIISYLIHFILMNEALE